MGIRLIIGQKYLEHDEGTAIEPYEFVASVTSPNAPKFENWEDQSNECYFLAPVLHIFVTETGLSEFINTYNVTRGFITLTNEHGKLVNKALRDYQSKHPDATPGFNKGRVWHRLAENIHSDVDQILAYLIWLEWWVIYTLETCTEPVIVGF